MVLIVISAAQDIRFPLTVKAAISLYGKPKQQGLHNDWTSDTFFKVARFTFRAFSFFFHRRIG